MSKTRTSLDMNRKDSNKDKGRPASDDGRGSGPRSAGERSPSEASIALTQDSPSSTPTLTPRLTATATNTISRRPSDPVIPTLDLDGQASNLILGAMKGRKPGGDAKSSDSKRVSTGAALAAIGLKTSGYGTSSSSTPRPITPPRTTGDSVPSPPPATASASAGLSKASFLLPSRPLGSVSGSTPAAAATGDRDDRGRQPRAPSPFFRARRSRDKARARAASPTVGPLRKDRDAESDTESVGAVRKFRPQASAYEDGVSDAEPGLDADATTDAESDDSEVEDMDDVGFAEDEPIIFDEETEKNTEANAFFYEGDASGVGGKAPDGTAGDDRLDAYGEEIEQDVLGEGPNVIEPPPSVFASSLHAPKRSKSLKTGFEMTTTIPTFARDRCTITITQGDPDDALEKSGRRLRRYVVLSDLSDESRYALEWAIGTVARDGDELFVISVKEDENKGVCMHLEV